MERSQPRTCPHAVRQSITASFGEEFAQIPSLRAWFIASQEGCQTRFVVGYRRNRMQKATPQTSDCDGLLGRSGLDTWLRSQRVVFPVVRPTGPVLNRSGQESVPPIASRGQEEYDVRGR